MNQATYTPEPITTVNEGDTSPVKESESLAMEYMQFAINTSRFLMQYTDFISRFMEEATEKDFRQLEGLMKCLDPHDPIPAGVAQSIEQAKTLWRIHRERVRTEEETV